MLTPKTLLHIIYKAAYNTVHHDGIEHAGYLAFLCLLALFPFLVFIVALAGFIGEGQAGHDFIHFVFAQLPGHMVQAIQPRVDEIISGPPQGLLTVAILGAIWTSSSAVEGYRTVLNRAYHVGTPPAYIWRRLLSILQIVLFSFVIVSGMIMLVVFPFAWGHVETIFGSQAIVNERLSRIIAYASLAVVFAGVAAAYYVLPNIRQRFLTVAPGAALVTMLWLGAARLLSIYLSQFHQFNLIYGSLGSFIAALLFFYVSNIIFIYGAELNYLLKMALGEAIVQKEAAAAEPH